MGREWFGLLPPELEIVTVAGETRGVAERLNDGEARADRTPPPDSEFGTLLPPADDRTTAAPGVDKPGDMLFRCIAKPGERTVRGGMPGDRLLPRCWLCNCCSWRG